MGTQRPSYPSTLYCQPAISSLPTVPYCRTRRTLRVWSFETVTTLSLNVAPPPPTSAPGSDCGCTHTSRLPTPPPTSPPPTNLPLGMNAQPTVSWVCPTNSVSILPIRRSQSLPSHPTPLNPFEPVRIYRPSACGGVVRWWGAEVLRWWRRGHSIGGGGRGCGDSSGDGGWCVWPWMMRRLPTHPPTHRHVEAEWKVLIAVATCEHGW